METVSWNGHTFYVCLKHDNWHDLPGVYVFTGLNHRREWYPIYVGLTESLAERLPNHERWLEASLVGATHVLATVVHQQAMRESLERRMIEAYQPALNEKYRDPSPVTVLSTIYKPSKIL